MGLCKCFRPQTAGVISLRIEASARSCFIYLSDAAQGGEECTENLFSPVQLRGRSVWSRS